ncbi:dephospho-CoA kinase [Marinobacterium jannaschii]|uniref:dephospho-CoA kinase n=1 Tax=Marinobacterium jannaschii TaxID=64970 RepID=UPI000482A1BE|nr:dephospho-CoA kinase [Marinobacterium jannaschii]
MFIVGLTGGIGSGKSAVSQQLESLGINIIDADIVAREVVELGESALDSIAAHFGNEVLLESGELNRAALRARVFAEPAEREWLEQLLHPLIRERIISQLQSSASEYTVLASPLLLETDQHLLVDHIIVVDVPEEIQVSRTTSRDQNSEQQVRAIIAAQMARKQRLEKADSVLDNSGDLYHLRQSVNQLHLKLLQLASESR